MGQDEAVKPRKTKYAAAAVLVLLLVASLVVYFVLVKSPGEEVQPEDTAQGGSPAHEVRYTDELSNAMDDVFTSRKELALTFNGMADGETMDKLLHELDQYRIKATFFLPGMRVAEEPDVAERILAAGHQIENNTLNLQDMSTMSYEQIYKDIRLANEVIVRELGMRPQYVRTKSGEYTENVRKAAAALGMKGVVRYSINPRDRDMQSAEEIGQYVARYMRRGSIVTLNTHINPEVPGAISYIAKAAEVKGFKLVTLNELLDKGVLRKPLEEIPGYDAAKVNLDYANVQYEMFKRLPTGKKQIALTFDDWGSEDTVSKLLGILEDYHVQATFFLVGEGVERNPNLARAIYDAGHEIANHSYSHRIVTTLTPEELQEDIVKAHRALTNAVQVAPLMIFRPPTGAIDEEAAKVIAATGYKTIALYDVTALDWEPSRSAAEIAGIIKRDTKDGSIILLHLHDNIHTPEALPEVLEYLLAQGYTFVKLTDLMHNAKK